MGFRENGDDPTAQRLVGQRPLDRRRRRDGVAGRRECGRPANMAFIQAPIEGLGGLAGR
jgi:hypothetical protein